MGGLSDPGCKMEICRYILDEISILSALISVRLSITLLMFIVFAFLSKFKNKVKVLTKHYSGS